jgi:hypothetical protein
MSPRDFSASLSYCWERTGIFLRRALHVQGCCFASVFLAAPINTYWRGSRPRPAIPHFGCHPSEQLREPHQVILDADIDHFGHPDAGHALMSAAANYPEDPPSADVSA